MSLHLVKDRSLLLRHLPQSKLAKANKINLQSDSVLSNTRRCVTQVEYISCSMGTRDLPDNGPHALGYILGKSFVPMLLTYSMELWGGVLGWTDGLEW